MRAIRREFWLLLRDRAALVWLGLAALVASLAIILGLQEIAQQRDTIAELVEQDRIERETVIAGQQDWGGAAYASFHLTYDAPSDFAFAAMGERDVSPWKHRVRMLALEGQIYESDAGHPDFALLGRFDYAFVVSLLAPLLLILLLHDVRATERAAGRHDWLSATAGKPNSPWLARSGLKTALLMLCLILPLWVGGLIAGSSPGILALASAGVVLHMLFWLAVCLLIDRFGWSAPVNLVTLLGVWLALAVVVPAVLRTSIDAAIEVPDGGEIVLTQREAVNDAWDLPKQETMEPFMERHPEWSDYAEVARPFEWKWYYAFQQVGDQKAETLSQAYREGRARRDRLAGALAWLAPPALLDRSLQSLAGTDTKAALAYEDRVRAYHAELREWYYPKLFRDEPFDAGELEDLPAFPGDSDV